MYTPVTTVQKTSLHPLIVAAAIAVVLFCGVGAAAILGWIPSSMGGNSRVAPSQLTASDPPNQSAKPVAPALAASEAVHHKSTHVNSVPEHSASAAPASCVDCGVIEAVHEVDTRGQGSGVGAAGGAVLGGLLGNQVGGGRGRELATIAGAIGGAFAGNQIEGNVKTSHSYDIIVRMNGGANRTFHQAEQPDWRSGDHVKIVDGMIRSNANG